MIQHIRQLDLRYHWEEWARISVLTLFLTHITLLWQGINVYYVSFVCFEGLIIVLYGYVTHLLTSKFLQYCCDFEPMHLIHASAVSRFTQFGHRKTKQCSILVAYMIAGTHPSMFYTQENSPLHKFSCIGKKQLIKFVTHPKHDHCQKHKL